MDQVQSSHPSQNTDNTTSWYVKDLKDLKPNARELFEKYSKIPSEDVVAHITQFRDKAYKVYPYPCLGRWAFLEMSICQSSYYDEILQRIKDGEQYLDIGCCVGQDIRKLVSDGAPSENMYGSDLQKDFTEIGYELFKDRDTLKTTFVTADILNPDSDLKQLDGTIDIVHAASFFHLFDWDDQVRAAKRLVKVMKAKPGVMVDGRQIGNSNAGVVPGTLHPTKPRFRHDADSFARMWKEVGEQTGTKWEVDARLDDEDLAATYDPKFDVIPDGTRWLLFAVRRV